MWGNHLGNRNLCPKLLILFSQTVNMLNHPTGKQTNESSNQCQLEKCSPILMIETDSNISCCEMFMVTLQLNPNVEYPLFRQE